MAQWGTSALLCTSALTLPGYTSCVVALNLQACVLFTLKFYQGAASFINVITMYHHSQFVIFLCLVSVR